MFSTLEAEYQPVRDCIKCSEVEKLIDDNFKTAVDGTKRRIVTGIVKESIEDYVAADIEVKERRYQDADSIHGGTCISRHHCTRTPGHNLGTQ